MARFLYQDNQVLEFIWTYESLKFGHFYQCLHLHSQLQKECRFSNRVGRLFANVTSPDEGGVYTSRTET